MMIGLLVLVIGMYWPLYVFAIYCSCFGQSSGIIRYFTIQNALVQGYFPVARFLVGAIGAALSMIVVSTFAILAGESWLDKRNRATANCAIAPLQK